MGRGTGYWLLPAGRKLTLERLRDTPDAIEVIVDENRGDTCSLPMHGLIDHSAAPMPPHCIGPEYRHTGAGRIRCRREHPESPKVSQALCRLQ